MRLQFQGLVVTLRGGWCVVEVNEALRVLKGAASWNLDGFVRLGRVGGVKCWEWGGWMAW